MSDSIVKGFCSLRGYDPTAAISVVTLLVIHDESIKAAGERYLLIPDDGTWQQMERDHRAMEELRLHRGRVGIGFTSADEKDWLYDGRGKDSRATDPADAILGTEGGEGK